MGDGELTGNVAIGPLTRALIARDAIGPFPVRISLAAPAGARRVNAKPV